MFSEVSSKNCFLFLKVIFGHVAEEKKHKLLLGIILKTQKPEGKHEVYTYIFLFF